MDAPPSLDVVKGRMNPPTSAIQEPLHAQLRRALRETIDTDFTDGQRFWPESILIKQLEISQITVRRALQGLVQDGVLERCPPTGSFVRKALESKTFSVGCFVPQYNSEFWNEILQQLAVVSYGDQRYFQTYLTHQGKHIQEVQRHLALARGDERYVLLGATGDEATQMWDVLDERGCRSVCIDTPAEARPAHFVGVDNARGIQLAMEHLRELGHQRVVFLSCEPSKHPSIVLREAAFRATIEEWDWKDSLVVACNTEPWESSYDAAWNAMERVWEHRPTAIFAISSDSGGLAALRWLAERGISVPRDVSVIGFDDIQSARRSFPPLTVIAHPYEAIARWAITLLGNPPSAPQKILLEPRLIIRRSTDPPPI